MSVVEARLNDARHEKTDLKIFVVVIPKEGWARLTFQNLILLTS